VLVGYARVSSNQQELSLQSDALTAAGCERIFQEKESGIQRDRPQLAAALEYMRNGDTLVVWRLDRLARSVKQLIETVEILERRGVELRCLAQPMIDTATPGGKLVFNIFSALAEFEVALIRDRTNAGLAAARARGRTGGRPPKLTEADKKKAHALISSGAYSMLEVARELGVSRATLYAHGFTKLGTQ
jgi:DNA invertase Pin-like site-specific DNA recombinase